MNDDQYSAFLAVLVPEVIGLIVRRHDIGEVEATRRFYSSELYARLSDEKLKLWHYSSETLYALYDEEVKSGRITFPEEAC